MMDPITALSVGGTALKTITGLFGNNDEEVRQERKTALLRTLGRIRKEARDEAFKSNAGYVANSRQAAAKRAGAQGRSAEASILPAERSAIQVGAENLRRTDAPFRQQELSIEQDFANRPIEDTFGQRLVGVLGEAGGAAAQYGMDKSLLDIMKGRMDDGYSPFNNGLYPTIDTDTSSMQARIRRKRSILG